MIIYGLRICNPAPERISRRPHAQAEGGYTMIPTEKLSAITIGIISGIAIAYIHKSKQLERLNGIQAKTIKELREYIEWTEEDHSKVHTRRCEE